MMQQYDQIKSAYPDCILFFRLGDFYEMFEEDARVGAQILDLTLTARPEGKDGRIPMCGVPYHAVDSYLNKLVRTGHKVAICEQIGPIPKQGIVKRDVIRIVTPGTIFDEKSLHKKENNYLLSIHISKKQLAIAAIDVTTGICKVGEWEFFDYSQMAQIIHTELTKFQAAECILSEELYSNPDILKILSHFGSLNISKFADWPDQKEGELLLLQHFKVHSLEVFGLNTKQAAQVGVASLFKFIQYTQRGQVHHLTTIQSIDHPDYLILDTSTILNLELFTTIRAHESKGTLIHVLDHTCTAMGGRLLREWLGRPSRNPTTIQDRLNTVKNFVGQEQLREVIRDHLKQIIDIERLIARLSVGIGNARDLANLKASLQLISDLSNIPETKIIASPLQPVIQLIQTIILDEPGLDIKNANMIKPGIHAELDKLHAIVTNSKAWISKLEQTEKEKTGIATLRIKFNQVFGFYIEVSKGQIDKVPAYYMRKQTLVNGERFITKELKAQEEIILSAEEKVKVIEYQIFQETLQKVLEFTIEIQTTAKTIAELDCLTNFAHNAVINRYTKPEINTTGELTIHQGRHPVVEQLLDKGTFVPNDAAIKKDSQNLFLLTGPNMAGKSVYMRQIALITLLAHMGSFVPATSANIPITDSIFVRSGASDVITSGMSTFMVEMVETAHILHKATPQSLIIMDEIGRGTSTYDGIAIAWAVAEYIVQNTQAKTLFATHYHELQELEQKFPDQIKNYHMSVDLHQGEPVFLHTLQAGPASHSFGISVAKKAGLPAALIERAKKIALQLEGKHNSSATTESDTIQPDVPTDIALEVVNRLAKIDLINLTPIQALVILAEMKETL